MSHVFGIPLVPESGTYHLEEPTWSTLTTFAGTELSLHIVHFEPCPTTTGSPWVHLEIVQIKLL